jgi:hypothetical protein
MLVDLVPTWRAGIWRIIIRKIRVDNHHVPTVFTNKFPNHDTSFRSLARKCPPTGSRHSLRGCCRASWRHRLSSPRIWVAQCVQRCSYERPPREIVAVRTARHCKKRVDAAPIVALGDARAASRSRLNIFGGCRRAGCGGRRFGRAGFHTASRALSDRSVL